MKGISTQKCFPTSKLAKTKILQHQKQNPKQHIETLKHWTTYWNIETCIETLKHIETTYWNFYCNRKPFLFSVMMFLVVACFKIYVPNFCLFLIFLTFISLNASFDEAWQRSDFQVAVLGRSNTVPTYPHWPMARRQISYPICNFKAKKKGWRTVMMILAIHDNDSGISFLDYI